MHSCKMPAPRAVTPTPAQRATMQPHAGGFGAAVTVEDEHMEGVQGPARQG